MIRESYDYFTEEVCAKVGNVRDAYTVSANDNTLVFVVSEDKYALGYFGCAYYVENKDRLNAIGVSSSDSLDDAVWPTDNNIESARSSGSTALTVTVRQTRRKGNSICGSLAF